MPTAEAKGNRGAIWKPSAKGLGVAGTVLLAIGVGMWRVSELYDLRVAAALADSKTSDFYTDISPLLFATLCSAGVAYALVAFWGRTPAWFGTNAAFFCIATLIVVSLLSCASAAFNFYNLKPKIAVSGNGISCDKHFHFQWADVAEISLRSKGSFRSARFVDVKPSSRINHPNLVESCSLDGLNEDYGIVYEAIRYNWQTALRNSSFDSSK